jgi:hypothetical protein
VHLFGSACLPAASRADPIRPRRSGTSFCPSDTRGPRVPALVERTSPVLVNQTPHQSASRETFRLRTVVKSSIRRARNKRCMPPLSDSRNPAQRLAREHVKRVERPRGVAVKRQFRPGSPFPSRLRCWRDATGATTPLLRMHALIARGLMESPPMWGAKNRITSLSWAIA